MTPTLRASSFNGVQVASGSSNMLGGMDLDPPTRQPMSSYPGQHGGSTDSDLTELSDASLVAEEESDEPQAEMEVDTKFLRKRAPVNYRIPPPLNAHAIEVY